MMFYNLQYSESVLITLSMLCVQLPTGNLASTYYEQGQLDMAILHYKQAVSCDPRFLEAYNNLVGFLILSLFVFNIYQMCKYYIQYHNVL